MGIEQAIRTKYPGKDDPLIELAAKLGQVLDAGDGSVAMVKELRSILRELSPEAQWGPSVNRSPSPALDELPVYRWEDDHGGIVSIPEKVS
jgi:hypothetical protein